MTNWSTLADQALVETERAVCADPLAEQHWAAWIDAAVASMTHARTEQPPRSEAIGVGKVKARTNDCTAQNDHIPLAALQRECAATLAQLRIAGMHPQAQALAHRLSMLAEHATLFAPAVVPSATLAPRWDHVIFFSSPFVTGGPEAIHQAAQTINLMGGCAAIAYYGGACHLEWTRERLLGVPQLPDAFREAFAHYGVPSVTDAALTPRTLLVLSEELVDHTDRDCDAGKAVWWLSVNNALRTSPWLRLLAHVTDQHALAGETATARARLIQSGAMHLCQSAYASAFLANAGVVKTFPLSDFIHRDYLASSRTTETPEGANAQKADHPTDPASARHPAPLIGHRYCAPDSQSAARTYDIAFFPSKGGFRATLFLAYAPALRCLRIADMTRQTVQAMLRKSTIYVDFGDHPGKDRVPREAAASGAVVFLHETGAARWVEDHPLESFYLFNEDDIINGSLLARVRDVLADPSPHLRRQWQYRQRIVLEQLRLEREVRSLFFMPEHREPQLASLPQSSS